MLLLKWIISSWVSTVWLLLFVTTKLLTASNFFAVWHMYILLANNVVLIRISPSMCVETHSEYTCYHPRFLLYFWVEERGSWCLASCKLHNWCTVLDVMPKIGEKCMVWDRLAGVLLNLRNSKIVTTNT